MKRFLGIFVIALLGVLLIGCGKKEFSQDGTFRAFEVGDNYGTPMITWADVVVKGGKVESITLDALQGSKSEETGYTWNEKSKKELGYAYRMHGERALSEEDYIKYLRDNNLLEWFEQAALIEAHFLANVGKDLSIDGITGVTIADGGYSNVVESALENARNNKFVAFETGLSSKQAQVVWVEVTTNGKGKVTKINLDTIQSANFVWKEKSKKELGYAYRMHGERALSEEDYIKYLKDNNLLEWFEQANLIEDAYLANNNASLDGVTGVTITTNSYENVFKAALKLVK
jgi:major membrane immunogen (membrane-anchored lipoprotein)